MPARNEDLHGNVPDQCAVALVLIDVINDMEFDSGLELSEQALPMARRLAELVERARAAHVPVIYVNDNFGRWRSDFRAQLAHCLEDDVRGREVARLLAPAEHDYFVLKPKHSGFFSTTLETLLEYLRARTLILTGLTTDLCVLFTASDAHMRDLNLIVPEDCCAARSADRHEMALRMLRDTLNIATTPSHELDLEGLLRESERA